MRRFAGKWGGAMARETQYQEHVRAARAWLCRAEVSLEKEDHIRGDLDVMLAQAELQRAQEVGRGASHMPWLRRAFSLGAASLAAVLAAGVWFSLAPPAVGEPPAARPVEPDTPLSAAVPSVGLAPLANDAVPQTAARSEVMPVAEEPPSGETLPHEDEARTEPLAPLPVRVPTRDMQKLMCTAGAQLRAP